MTTRWTVAGLLAATCLATGPVTAIDSTSAGASDPVATASAAMPANLRLAMTRSLARDAGPEYRIDADGRGANPRHRLRLAFTAAGAHVTGPVAATESNGQRGTHGELALRLERFGRGAGEPVRRAAPRIDGAIVEYDRGSGLREWFVNLPQGVEQGWTMAQRPAGDGPLLLELDTGRPPDRVESPAHDETRATADARFAWSGLVYHGLIALDAEGRELPARWTSTGRRVRIEVDDAAAVYPLLIDPWVEQAELVADDGMAEDSLGVSVAVYGNTALVGADQADVDGNTDQGAAYVFLRSGDVWNQQAKLTAENGAADDGFGTSVALSGDTAIVGAAGADGTRGAAYVFTRSGVIWSQQAELTAKNDGSEGDAFGSSVAVDDDTALVAAPFASPNGMGAVDIFVRSGDDWTPQARLSLAVEDLRFGTSVAVDNDTAVVGAVSEPVGLLDGVALIYTRSGDEWSGQDVLHPSPLAARFGFSVALAGNTILVGAPEANSRAGAVYVFTRDNDDEWSQQTVLAPEDEPAIEYRTGHSVDLSDDGDTALAGAPGAHMGDRDYRGAAYVFVRDGGTWEQQAKLLDDDGAASDRLGWSVALGGDGKTVLVGALGADEGDASDQGKAYAFVSLEVPSLDVAPATLSATLDEGQTETRVLTLTNLGEQTLEWEVTEEGGGCTLPTWIDTDPSSGSVPGDGSQEIDVTFDATGLEPDDYEAHLCIASNDPEQPILPVPLALTVMSGGEDILTPVGLAVDFSVLESDGNGVFDPDETVEMAPFWRNDGDDDVFTDGILFDFMGPGGASYTIVNNGVGFGPVPPGEVGSCQGSEVGCYEMEILLDGPDRPAPHWDATVDEEVQFGPSEVVTQTWTLHVGESFADVAPENPFYPSIETLLHAGVTGGCTDTEYCPAGVNTRSQMPVFVLKAVEGPDYLPPACDEDGEAFADVPFDSPFCPWIEELARRDVVSGCGGDDYCPGDPVTRAQMAIFLLKTLEGGDYTPPECSSTFDDVPCPSLFADWIEELAAREITGGCTASEYCPGNPVTRAQMAVFVTKTFGLTLYGP